MSAPVVHVTGAVLADPLTPAIIRMLAALDNAARVYGCDLTVTAIRNDHTSGGHVRGAALDVRTRDLPDAVVKDLYGYLKKYLGPLFTVLYEIPSLGHTPSPVLVAIVTKSAGATAPHLHLQVKIGAVFPEQTPLDPPGTIQV